jgi:DNA topoisomerase-1
LDKQDFLLDFYRKLEYAIANNVETIGDTLQLAEKYCPSCGSAMVVRRSRYGKLFYGCSQYPNCRSIIGID